jgi:hypothetical protein
VEDTSYHAREKTSAEEFYKGIQNVHCPYFSQPVIFNSDGFNHLQFSAGRERDKSAQIFKFNLLPFAPDIIRKSGTIQEYRKQWGKVGRKRKDGFQDTKEMEYWGLIALVPDKNGPMVSIKVILRRVGDGNITFWSVMRTSRPHGRTFQLASGDPDHD